MAILNVNLTRIESINMKKSLKTAQRGHKLLKDKLDELIKKILELVQKNEQLRKKTDEMLTNAYQNFMLAKAVMGEEGIEEALVIPKQSVSVDISETSIMSVKIPQFNFGKNSYENNNKVLYGFAYTTSELDNELKKFKNIDIIARRKNMITDIINVVLKTFIPTISLLPIFRTS